MREFNISLRKFFDPSRLSVIFVPIVAAAATSDGGCSSMPDPGPLTAEETLQVVSGNTFQKPDQEIYAFADESGDLRGLNLSSGGRTGQWRVDDRGQLCAFYNEVENGAEKCGVLSVVQDNQVRWLGVDMLVLEGNPQEL